MSRDGETPVRRWVWRSTRFARDRRIRRNMWQGRPIWYHRWRFSRSTFAVVVVNYNGKCIILYSAACNALYRSNSLTLHPPAAVFIPTPTRFREDKSYPLTFPPTSASGYIHSCFNWVVVEWTKTLALGVGGVEARPLGGGWGSPSYEGVHRIIRKKVPRTKTTPGTPSSLALTGSWSRRRQLWFQYPGRLSSLAL